MTQKTMELQDAFISYGRADSKAFATKLYERLIDRGLKVWFDQNDIPLGVDFQNQIDEGLERSQNFIFIIAPHSINSIYCGKEIDLAILRHKRIIPVLHVEQITQETWQQRNPSKTLEDWKLYQEKGLHSSFPNMHPTIGKINWVYMREGIDDFEKSFAGLLEIFERHQGYVKQHTHFLVKALQWERNQKRSDYLLVGEECHQSREWLKTRFQREQPPCTPTDLHCSFICESVKNANNLMTDVFLSYSTRERDVMEKVVKSLMREGLTVWTNKTDIKTGAAFGEVIDRGIEEADTIVYLMSPDSLKSEYCQKELEYGRSLNKRIIPLLIAPVETLEMIPPELRAIQFINMTDHEDEAAYQKDIDKLIRILVEDASYYEQHKILLTKALKWERQKQNPSVLLRDYNLRQAEAWLKIARTRSSQQPTTHHETYIAESLKQPPEATLDVFISYDRLDSDFVRKLNDGLQVQGKTTWFDQESIASGGDFQQEVQQGIERCTNFLFVISPNSVSSEECKRQIEYAATLNKRFVPVLYQAVPADQLSPLLTEVQSVDFRRNDGDFFTNFGDLIRTLETDREYLKAHTRLQVRAMEWDQEGRDDSFLLRGKDLVSATQWQQQAEAKTPPPTPLQWQYLHASRELPNRRIRFRYAALTSIAATALVAGLRWLGWMQPIELAAYDSLLRLRPAEAVDKRFLIVAVDEATVDAIDQNERYRQGRGTLPDLALSDLLKNLNQAKPRLIGLDFFRDFVALPELKKTFSATPNLIGICRGGGLNEQGKSGKGTKAPIGIPIERVGYNNLTSDGFKFIRRQYLEGGGGDDFCPPTDSISLVLARQYLAQANKAYVAPFDPAKNDYTRSMQFGDLKIVPLWGDGSGYRDQGSQLGGYQALLNYRVPQDGLNNSLETVSVKDVLAQKIPPEVIRDRIVLIGYVDRAEKQADYWFTPYGQVPGVLLQAQMASQVISATLDGRPLIWWWPLWAETVWSLGWAVVAGTIVWKFRRPRRLAIAGAILVVSLCGVCYVVLAFGAGWLPLAPPLVAIVLAGAGVSYLNYRLRR